MMDEHFENPESLAQAMTEWIEFYNNRRIRTKLRGKSPVQYRELANQLVA
jgi:putative transposase